MKKKLLEIESKFHFHQSLLPRFRSNRGNPPFRKLEFLRTHTFADTYFDRGGVLCANGLWVRERVDGDGGGRTFEAKHRLSGTYNRSTFHELTDPTAIRAQIQRYLPPDPNAHVVEQQQQQQQNNNNNNFGLDIMAHLVTTRQTYLADEKFTVVLDQTDFGHSVGEVELLVEVGGDDDVDDGDVDAEKEKEKAHRDIDGFLKRYKWFCESGSGSGEGKGAVEGKLEAYFRLKGEKNGGRGEVMMG